MEEESGEETVEEGGEERGKERGGGRGGGEKERGRKHGIVTQEAKGKIRC